MPKTTIKTNVPLLFIKEGNIFVCYAPAFDLAAHGNTFEDARKSFVTTFKLFVEEVTKMKTWPQVLKEYGKKDLPVIEIKNNLRTMGISTQEYLQMIQKI